MWLHQVYCSSFCFQILSELYFWLLWLESSYKRLSCSLASIDTFYVHRCNHSKIHWDEGTSCPYIMVQKTIFDGRHGKDKNKAYRKAVLVAIRSEKTCVIVNVNVDCCLSTTGISSCNDECNVWIMILYWKVTVTMLQLKDHFFKKRYHCIQGSKKKNSPAKLFLLELIMFPRHKVSAHHFDYCTLCIMFKDETVSPFELVIANSHILYSKAVQEEQ